MSIDCALPTDTEKLEIFAFELAAAPPGFGVNGSVGPPGGSGSVVERKGCVNGGGGDGVKTRQSVSLGAPPKQVYGYGGDLKNIYSQSTVPRISKRTRSISISSEHHRILNGVKGNSAAILYRRSDGTPVLRSLASLSLDEDTEMNENEHISSFFKWYKCYDLMPTSAKLVVLDTRLVLKKAFYAMVDTGVRACTLWDSNLQQFVGMLTITDFIRILHNNYKGQGETMTAFEEQRLCDVKGVKTEQLNDIYHIYPESSLYSAAMMLLQKKIHRLPIIDPANGNVLAIITQKPIIKFLYTFFPNLDRVPNLQKSIKEAGVGSFDAIKVATMDTTIIGALNMFVEEGISALPIVDSERKLIHIYSKFDVINLAAEKTYAYLDVTLAEATKHKSSYFSGVHSCKGEDTVFSVMERLVKTDVARLVITDDNQQVCGVVTVSDMIFYLMFHGGGTDDGAGVSVPTGGGRTLSRTSFGGSISSGGKSLSSSYSPPSAFNV